MPATDTQFPDPQEGGRYVRNADGSLTQIHKTLEAPLESAGGAVTSQPAADTVDGGATANAKE